MSSHSTPYETDAGSVKLSLHLRHLFRRHFPKQVQKKPAVERDNKLYLCKDMVPYQNVDRKGFKEMFKTLEPRFALPARTHFIQIETPKRPHHHEQARSSLISEAKHGRAWLVLGWETAWEYQVL